MKQAKTLTIGIPTYNGSKFISETIESILMQIDSVDSSEIEILILDNASTDLTSDILHEYIKQYPELISYYKNKSNIGYDRNVDKLFKKAKGEFVEILGDDDFYEANDSLSEILNVIKRNNDLSVLLLSVGFLRMDNSERTNSPIRKDIICKNGDEFFSASKWGSSAVSSLVIKTSVWNSINLDRYFGTQWIHVGAILNILKKNAKSYIMNRPTIVVRIGNNRWEGNFGNQLECGLDHLDIFQEMIELGYKKETFELFLNDRYKNNIKDILILGPNKYSDRIKVLKSMVHLFKKYPLFWIIHIPAILIPKYVYNFIFKILKFFIYGGKRKINDKRSSTKTRDT